MTNEETIVNLAKQLCKAQTDLETWIRISRTAKETNEQQAAEIAELKQKVTKLIYAQNNDNN